MSFKLISNNEKPMLFFRLFFDWFLKNARCNGSKKSTTQSDEVILDAEQVVKKYLPTIEAYTKAFIWFFFDSSMYFYFDVFTCAHLSPIVLAKINSRPPKKSNEEDSAPIDSNFENTVLIPIQNDSNSQFRALAHVLFNDQGNFTLLQMNLNCLSAWYFFLLFAYFCKKFTQIILVSWLRYACRNATSYRRSYF